jgi:hypothetical protein
MNVQRTIQSTLQRGRQRSLESFLCNSAARALATHQEAVKPARTEVASADVFCLLLYYYDLLQVVT